MLATRAVLLDGKFRRLSSRLARDSTLLISCNYFDLSSDVTSWRILSGRRRRPHQQMATGRLPHRDPCDPVLCPHPPDGLAHLTYHPHPTLHPLISSPGQSAVSTLGTRPLCSPAPRDSISRLAAEESVHHSTEQGGVHKG